MFVVLLTYRKPLEEVMAHLDAHRAWLDGHYAAGRFLCSGPQVPRTGGVILCRAGSREEVDTLTADDPFRLHGIADYTIVEFQATHSAPGFEAFL